MQNFLTIGEVLDDVVPHLNLGFHSINTPSYFQDLADVVAVGRMADLVTSTSWESVTNKIVYQNHLQSLPATKVELTNGGDFSRVWKRLSLANNALEDHDVLFLLVHQKLPVRERLFRINVENDPYCFNCLNEGLVEIDDFQHFFCTCGKVSSVWKDIKEVAFDLMQTSNVTNESLLCLQFPTCQFDQEICWLLGSYFSFIWKLSHVKKSTVIHRAQVFGFLKFKYKISQLGARIKLDARLLNSLRQFD